MCVSPQRRTIFRRVKSKKCFGPDVFCTFSLANVLFATGAYNFSTSERTKVVQTRHVLCIFTSECAFRHSGVQFLISPLTTWLRTRRFNRPTFRLTWHTNHWKNTAFRDFSNISRACIFFLLTFWLLHLLSIDLTTLLLSYASAFELSYCWAMHLLFNCPYCRKFLFKLPSIIRINHFIAQHTHTRISICPYWTNNWLAPFSSSSDQTLPLQTGSALARDLSEFLQWLIKLVCSRIYGWNKSECQGLGCVFFDQQVLRWPTE